MTLFCLQQLSGINAVIYYAPQIFHEAGFDSVSTQVLATVGVGSVNLLTTVVALALVLVASSPLVVDGLAVAIGLFVGLAIWLAGELLASWVVQEHT